ncbi:hypothetical protein ACFU99_06190 [Streptomyces sp. NPDC057654]|uniref:hypothetical protein n=1 Tax=Streptomyces sp. NPDC057654 TaxID=3346196 RepID=UPI003690DEFF
MTGTTSDLKHFVNRIKRHLEEAGRRPRPPLEAFGYLKRTKKRSFRQEQVVCYDPELLQGEPPAPEKPAPGNQPESGLPASGNQVWSARRLKTMP